MGMGNFLTENTDRTPTPECFFYEVLSSRFERDQVVNDLLGGWFDVSKYLYENESQDVDDAWLSELKRICRLYERGY